MSINKTEYRIEVWQDEWNGSVWTESKVVTIGANDMDFLGKARNPVLKIDVNGEVTFSFDMNTRYFDSSTGKKEDNYLLSYLFNEAKIKVYCPEYDDGINGGWFDFIIKEIKENRGTNISYSYVCQYLPINELSKTGQTLTFSLDQENGTGKIDELEQKVIDGTDWILGDIAADLTEATEETLFKVTTAQSLNLTGMPTMAGKPDDITNLPIGSVLYVPYNEILATTSSTIQVIYVTEDLILANGNIISNKKCNYTIDRASFGTPAYAATSYRGYRIVLTYQTEYKNVSNDAATPDYRYVTVYNKTGSSTVYYGYTNTEVVYATNCSFTAGSLNLVNKIGHGYSNGDLISFAKINTTTGIAINTFYFVINKTDDNFQLCRTYSTTLTNTPVLLTNNGTGTVIMDGDELAVESVQHYFYYNGTTIINADSETGLVPVLITNSQKYRTLEASQSNRFNLTQSIAELFEVWARFDIYHDATGAITSKRISFVDTIGAQNWAGFTYGVNLTGITRNVVSTNLSTKMFVTAIENENLSTGSCSIAYAKGNTAKEEFLINLDYYTQVGLLDNEVLTYDLYDVNGSTGIGYLTKLGNLNIQYDNYSNTAVSLETYIIRYTELVAAMDYAITEAQEIADKIWTAWNGGVCHTDAQTNYDTNYARMVELVANNTAKRDSYQAQLNYYNSQKTQVDADKASILEQKTELDEAFNTKYSRYIQEGTWTGESTYIDDDLYYYDAQNVLLESSRPSIEYTINVVDISILTGYEDYSYKIGDITYIEDVEYFGYTTPDIHGNSIPYREQVIISSIECNLDNPTSNKITIQNYKNQFDSLFQRVTATVQTYQLNEQVYQRANNFTTNGQITFDSLQSSLINNSLILSRSLTEDVIIDKTGISLTDQENPLKKVRIVSGGIFLSDHLDINGNIVWESGITGEGINTNLLTAGQIDVGKINIMSGKYPTFSWDSTGLYAYKYDGIPGPTLTMDRKKYVKFNQDGIKGINKVNEADEETIANTFFKLNWDGLYLKTGNGAYDIQLGLHKIKTSDTEQYLFSAVKNADKSRIFSISETGDAFFAGTVNVKELYINGVEALTADNKIKSDFIDVTSLTAETISTSNAWISNLYAEVVNTNFLDYITGTDVNGATIGNNKLKRNYIHIEDQRLEMIEQVLTLTPVDFTIPIDNINRQVYYTLVRGENAYNFYSIVSPIETAIRWSPYKSYNTNQILLGEDNNYYYALDGYTNSYPDWATALASGFLIITTEEEHKVQVKTITNQNIKSSYSFVDINGVATPRIQLGIGTGVANNGKGYIWKDETGLLIEYNTTSGIKNFIRLDENGISSSPAIGGGGDEGLNRDLIYYVSATGNDTTGTGSTTLPFATIGHCISIIPYNLNGHTVTINIGAGTFTNKINSKTYPFSICNFYRGHIKIIGAGRASTVINEVLVYNCDAIHFGNLNITSLSSSSGAAIVCDKSRIYIDGELDIHANRGPGSFGYGIWARNDSSIISNYENINFYDCTIAVFGDTLSRVFIGSMSGTGTSTVAMKAEKGSFVGTGGIEIDTFTTYTQTEWAGTIINEINTRDFDA